ncbi:unnamed protein product [Haemonchus placei]|uniref:Uncharacterized protein n=1 Tax=Haemonchus placei TaxID=6290 RepID=A0A0N4W577_HAEPC|nr:unnamed protein product [Haemonchus placei]
MLGEPIVFFLDVVDSGIFPFTRKGSEVVSVDGGSGASAEEAMVRSRVELWNNSDDSQAKSPIEDDVAYFIMELFTSRSSRANLGVKITDDDLEESVIFSVEPLQIHIEHFELFFFVALCCFRTNRCLWPSEEDTYAADACAVACSKEQPLSSLKYSVQWAMPSRLGQSDDVVLDLASSVFYTRFRSMGTATTAATRSMNVEDLEALYIMTLTSSELKTLLVAI